jgi:hypothetical protein
MELKLWLRFLLFSLPKVHVNIFLDISSRLSVTYFRDATKQALGNLTQDWLTRKRQIFKSPEEFVVAAERCDGISRSP